MKGGWVGIEFNVHRKELCVNVEQTGVELPCGRMIFYLGWLLLLVGGGKTGGDLEKRWADDPRPRSTGDGDLFVPGSCCGSSCSFSFPGVF